MHTVFGELGIYCSACAISYEALLNHVTNRRMFWLFLKFSTYLAFLHMPTIQLSPILILQHF